MSAPTDPAAVARARERVPDADDVARLSAVLSLMTDPVRLRILYALDVTAELSVGDLALALELNEDQINYGLRVLRTAGLIYTRRDGRTVFNRLATDFPEPLREHCLRQIVDLTRQTTKPID